MRLFYIRNTLMLRISEDIITSQNLDNCHLYIADNLSLSNDYKNMLSLKANQTIWKNIISNPRIIKKKKGIKLFFLSLKYSKEKIIEYENLINVMRIREIYISNTRAFDERIINLIATKNSIKLFKIDEGISGYQSNINKLSIIGLVKKVTKSIISGFYLRNHNINPYSSKNRIEKYERYYSLYPEFLEARAKKNVFKISFPLDEINHLNNQELNQIKNIYVSQPLSEDNILSIESEVENILKLNENFENLYIKVHPRDSIKKMSILSDNSRIRFLPKDLQDISVESLSKLPNLKNVIGYYSTSLIFFSQETKIHVQSLIKVISTKNIQSIYLFFKKNASNIEYIDKL